MGAAIFVSGRRHVFFNWRPHPAELMRPGVNFRGTRGLGSALVFRRLPAIACNGSRTCAGVCVGVRHGFFCGGVSL